MPTKKEMTNRRSGDGQIPVSFQSLCSELSRSGQLHLRKISTAIDALAPQPGVLLYMYARKIAVRVDGMEPIMFSAVDASTHLQVAQIHLATTTAAAVSFVDFAVKSFPFRIQRVKTHREMPFHSSGGKNVRHNFTSLLAHRNIVHSLITDLPPDALSSISSRLLFGGMPEVYMLEGSGHGLQRELAQFLFFHNNYRSVPWLDGQTPMQKLRSFTGFAWMHSFNPDGESEVNVGSSNGQLPAAQGQFPHTLFRP